MKAQIELVPIDSVTLDPANVRLHPSDDIEVIKGSLAKFGQQKPIVVGENNVVIAGNGLLQAARELGWKEIAIVRTALRGVDATAFAIADNRTAERSEWDYEGLSSILKQLQVENYDLGVLGWRDYELEPLLKAEWQPPPPGDSPTTTTTAAPGGGGGGNWIEVTVEERKAFDRAARIMVDLEGLQEAADGQVLRRICELFSQDYATPEGK
jgi:hypothetical protein